MNKLPSTFRSTCSLVFYLLLIHSRGSSACTPDDWAKASKAFQQSLVNGDLEQIEKAAAVVSMDNSKRAVELILKALKSESGSTYWSLIASLGKVSSAEALEVLGEEAVNGKVPEIKRDLIMSFRLCNSVEVSPVLHRILEQGTPDVQASTIDEIVDRHDVGAVPRMIALAEKDLKGERELTRRVFRALRAISGEAPRGAPPNWGIWWAGVKGAIPEPKDRLKPGFVGETVVDSLRHFRATQYEELKRGSKERTVVMTGEYDSVEDVLARLKIPTTVTSFAALKVSGEDILKNAEALFINCAANGDWPEAMVRRIREYVAQGGYLFVSDLGVPHLVRHAFPGYMQFKAGNLSSQSVSVYPARGSTGHPFMKGIDRPWLQGQLKGVIWQIDEGGPTLQFDAGKVISLIESADLAKKKKPPSVAVTFSYSLENGAMGRSANAYGGVYEEGGLSGGGKVLCVLSHFAKQKQGEDGFTLQNMLLNFLIEARDRKLMREDAKAIK